jgi:DNA-binding cell septation regulator SpoVG
MVGAAPVLPTGYVVNASRIADRRMILAGYRLVELLTRILKLLIEGDQFSSILASLLVFLPSLDHLIRSRQYIRRNRQADLLSGRHYLSVFDNCFAVGEIRVMQGSTGLFVLFPAKKLTDSTHWDITFPANTETRRRIEQAILAEYEKVAA